MPRVLRFTCLGLLALCLASPAHAARFSGIYLLQLCASDKDGKEIVAGGHAACQSYISGVIDYHNLIRSLGTSPSVDFCLPDGESLDKIQKYVAAYLYRNQKIHGSFVASPAVVMALNQAYPCGKKK